MTLLPLFISCVFTLFALWLMISPFLGGNEAHLRLEHLDDEVREIELLVTRQQVLVTSLRELEFDFETAKIADDDYEKFRRRYEAEAVRIMRRLDELHGGKEWKLRVEEEIAQRLGRPSVLASDSSAEEPAEAAEVPVIEVSAPEKDEAVEEVAEVETVANETANGCPGCGERLQDDDKFCSQCGAAVAATESTAQPPNEASA